MESSPPESFDLKAAFRKPSNDAANRNYRRRSPTNGSFSSDGKLSFLIAFDFVCNRLLLGC